MPASSFLETSLQDLRFGARALRRNPGFAAIAVADAGARRRRQRRDLQRRQRRPAAAAAVERARPRGDDLEPVDRVRQDLGLDGEVNGYRAASRTLADVAAWSEGQVNLTGDGEPERLRRGSVTANLFSVLGVTPLLGRAFTAEEDVPNGPHVVVLGHALWQRRYAGDPGDRRPRDPDQRHARTRSSASCRPDFVLPTDFQNPAPSQLWTPLQMDPASTDHGSHGLLRRRRG